MSASEKRWVTIFSFLVMLITTLPYLTAFWLQGADWRFSGFLIGVEDGNSYLAKMLLGSSGAWLFKTPYTAYDQNGFLAFLPYLLLGKLAAAPAQHEQLIVLFQVFRWAAGFCMILATYQFTAYFIQDPRYRKFGTALITCGGGLGWLFFLGFQQPVWGERIPLEFYSPESFGFLSVFSLPHLAMGRALLLWGLLRYWQSYQVPFTWKRWILSGLIWFGLGLMQPLTVLVGWMLVGLDVVIRCVIRRLQNSPFQGNWKHGFVEIISLIIFSGPIVLYTLVSFLNDPFLKTWSEQNIIMSPPPVDYLAAFGLALPFILLGARRFVNLKPPETYVLCAWMLLLPVLAYFPNNLQRRMPEGIWTAFGISAIFGLSILRGRWRKPGYAVLCSSFIITGLLLTGSWMAVIQPNQPIYQPVEKIRAYEFLNKTAVNYPVVLAAYENANVIPAYAAVRTLIGHGPESIHLKEVQPRVAAFYQADTPDIDRRQLIDEFKIQYIFWGPEEKKLGDWNPASFAGLARIFENETCEIYRVEE